MKVTPDMKIKLLEEDIAKLKNIISRIEDKAFDWDGRESMHYGNAIMRIIHPNWEKKYFNTMNT